MSRGFRISLAVITAFVLLFIFGGGRVPLGVGIFLRLLIGWATFARRIAAEMTIDWGAVTGALVILAAFTAGLHRFLRWLRRSRAVSEDPPPPAPLCRTLGIVGMLTMMFLLGIAGIGIIHQSTWLFGGREPLTTRRERPSNVAASLRSLAERSNWNAGQARRGLRAEIVDDADHFRVLVLDGPGGKFAGVAVVPRDPAIADRVEPVVVDIGEDLLKIGTGELPKVIADLKAGLRPAERP